MARQFYDLDVRAAAAPREKMLQRAAALGFTGVAVTGPVDKPDDVAEVRDTAADIETDLDVRIGARLEPDDPERLKELLAAVRDDVDVVIVAGGDVDVNRAACGDTRVDVLAHPERERRDPGIDHVMARQAAENQVAIGIVFRLLLPVHGKERALLLSRLRKLVRRCTAFNTPIVAVSGAESPVELRAPRELAAVPRVLGVDAGGWLQTVSDVPVQVVRRADAVREDGFSRPGVTVE